MAKCEDAPASGEKSNRWSIATWFYNPPSRKSVLQRGPIRALQTENVKCENTQPTWKTHGSIGDFPFQSFERSNDEIYLSFGSFGIRIPRIRGLINSASQSLSTQSQRNLLSKKKNALLMADSIFTCNSFKILDSVILPSMPKQYSHSTRFRYSEESLRQEFTNGF